MSIARDILTANRRFNSAYQGATVWTKRYKPLVMREGVILDNDWYIFVVGCFLIDLLKKRKKRGGVNEW